MNTKKRFIILTIVLAAVMVISIIYVAVDGSTLTETLHWITNDTMAGKALRAEVDHPDVLSIDEAVMDSDGHPVLSVTSRGAGEATVTLFTENMRSYQEHFYVSSFGTTFDTDTLNFDGYLIIEHLILICLALVFLVTVWSFIECFVKAKFSYSMVAFGGVALFCASLMTVVIYFMQWRNDFSRFLTSFMSTGLLFAYVSAPVMLGLSFAISVSNIWLLRHEGFRPQNMLGIVLSVVWIIGLAVTFVVPLYLRSINDSIVMNISYCLAYVISFMACMLLSTMVCAFLSAKRKADYDKDYLITLGCCIRPDGSLTPILRGRVDAAIRFEREQFAATGRHAKFVPSGGQGDDEVISESEAMARYLMEQGYPEEQIVREDKSVNTDQNIRFSRDKIIADAGGSEDVKVGVATTNYHVFRSYVLAKKHGLDAQGISAKTKWYFFPNAFLREFVGLLYDQKWKIIAIIAILLVNFIIADQMLSVRYF